MIKDKQKTKVFVDKTHSNAYRNNKHTIYYNELFYCHVRSHIPTSTSLDRYVCCAARTFPNKDDILQYIRIQKMKPEKLFCLYLVNRITQQERIPYCLQLQNESCGYTAYLFVADGQDAKRTNGNAFAKKFSSTLLV